jgi:hypothetical protein
MLKEIYVADHFNQSIRKITLAGTVLTVAGNNGVPGLHRFTFWFSFSNELH